MARVVVLPGVCGSEIGLDRWLGITRYWLHPPLLALQGPGPLIVNEEGTGDAPNPGFRSTVITGILWPYYGRICDHFLALGHDVYAAAYDWRLGIKQVATDLWPKLVFWAGDEPLYLVGHSLGGMVGRGLIRVATDARAGGQIVRLLTLGTPHQGSLSIPRLWARLGSFWLLLGVVFYPGAAIANAVAGAAGPAAVVDGVISTLVSTYSLLPQPGAPTLTGGYDYAAVMDKNTYITFNGYLDANRFAMAKDEHTWLQASVYPAQQLSVIGTGLQTAYQVRDVKRIGFNDGYLYTQFGDGTVDLPSATLPNVPSVLVQGIEHQAMPYAPFLLPRLPNLLFNGHD